MARSKRTPDSPKALSDHELGVLSAVLSVDADAVFPDTADEDAAVCSLVRRGILEPVPQQGEHPYPGARLKYSRPDAAHLLVAAQIPEPMAAFGRERAEEIWAQRGPQMHLPLLPGEEAYVRWLWYQQPGTWTQADVFRAILHGRISPPPGPSDMRVEATAAVAADGALAKLLAEVRHDHPEVDASTLSEAVVDTAARAGMPLPEIVARPWTAMHVFREVQDFRARVDHITSDTR